MPGSERTRPAPRRAAPGEPSPGLSPEEASALAPGSRARLAVALAIAPAGLTVAQLAERVGLHGNAVRQHLRVLARAGVVVSAPSAPTGRRGRPSARYALAAPHGVAAVGHRELVRLLLEMVRVAGFDEGSAEEFGREHGAAMIDADPAEGAEAVRSAMAGMGFAPDEVTTAARRGAGDIDLRLRSCPFKEAVLAPGGEMICALHRGLVDGTLRRVAPGTQLADFRPEDPVTAGCRVLISGAAPAAGRDEAPGDEAPGDEAPVDDAPGDDAPGDAALRPEA